MLNALKTLKYSKEIPKNLNFIEKGKKNSYSNWKIHEILKRRHML